MNPGLSCWSSPFSSYPLIFSVETQEVARNFLALDTDSAREDAIADSGMEEGICEAKLRSYVDASDSSHPTFPVHLQPASPAEAEHLALFLISKHMRHFHSSHCTPLPLRFFDLPWSAAGQA